MGQDFTCNTHATMLQYFYDIYITYMHETIFFSPIFRSNNNLLKYEFGYCPLFGSDHAARPFVHIDLGLNPTQNIAMLLHILLNI